MVVQDCQQKKLPSSAHISMHQPLKCWEIFFFSGANSQRNLFKSNSLSVRSYEVLACDKEWFFVRFQIIITRSFFCVTKPGFRLYELEDGTEYRIQLFCAMCWRIFFIRNYFTLSAPSSFLLFHFSCIRITWTETQLQCLRYVVALNF